MASTYTANSPQDLPASLETIPRPDGLITVNSNRLVSFIISGDNNATTTTINYNITGDQVWTNPKDAVDFFNAQGQGIPPNDIEWYVPGAKVFTNTGIYENIGGNRIGVRTKTYKGYNSLIRVNPSSTGVGEFQIYFPNSSGTTPVSRGIQGFTELLTQPSPGDPFIAQSVNIYQKGLRDRSAAITQDLMKFATPILNGITAENYGPDTVLIKPISGIQLINRDNNKPTYEYTDVQTAVSTTLAANTLYYVYCFSESKTLNFEISTTAPAANRINKTGDPTKRYLLSFATDSNSRIYPFTKKGSIYTFLPEVRFLLDGTAITPTTLQLNNLVPNTTQIIKVHATLTIDPANLAQETAFFAPGGLGNTIVGIQMSTNNRKNRDGFLTLITSPSNSLDYSLIFQQDKLSLYLAGYVE